MSNIYEVGDFETSDNVRLRYHVRGAGPPLLACQGGPADISDTLADALVRCVHSLQEEFPVVRGPQLVGIVSRQRIVDALRNDGNGYVQAVMSRAFQVARPEDTLGTTIRRLTAGHGLSLIPITDSGRVVGIVSVQNLMSSMALLAEQRRIERQETEE